MTFQLDLRREMRGRVIMPGAIRHNVTCRAEVAIADLSTSGCRINRPGQDLAIGSAVFVRLHELAPLRAMVRWNQAGLTGLEFEQPLYIAVLDHLLNQWQVRMTAELVAI